MPPLETSCAAPPALSPPKPPPQPIRTRSIIGGSLSGPPRRALFVEGGKAFLHVHRQSHVGQHELSVFERGPCRHVTDVGKGLLTEANPGRRLARHSIRKPIDFGVEFIGGD